MIHTALDPTDIANQISGDAALFEVVFIDHAPHNYRAVQDDDQALATCWNDTLRAKRIFKSPCKAYPLLTLDDRELAPTEAAF